ncbi:uncharacterized protein LOC122463994 isoform X2 [Chelonia mydas]|uniref:uncharacterized protein LOC122463994 isoform X2 n=1 Tax=Chelonia mydas TaxID=8469 RepID=UPI001CA8CFF5|nr:uncharacterized protein LOC122463994 isoform X2 [Chelonia mydas]
MPPPQPIPAGRGLPRQELAPPPAAFSGPGAASSRAAGGPGMALALRLGCRCRGRSRLHSRRVLNTVVSEPGPGLPWFSRVGYVDDQAIFVYASGMQRVEPRTDGAERGSGALGLSAPLVTALGGLDQRESEHPGSALQSDRGYRVSPWYRLFKHLLQKYVLPGMLNGKHQGSNCKRYTSVPLIAKALPQSLPHVKSSPLCSSDSPSVWLLKLSSHP